MNELMTKQFCKMGINQNKKFPKMSWLQPYQKCRLEFSKQILVAIFTKRESTLRGKGKSGGGRTIICYKKEDRAIFIHGFAKNEKAKLSKKELHVFKEFSKILLGLSPAGINLAIKNRDLIEVKS